MNLHSRIRKSFKNYSWVPSHRFLKYHNFYPYLTESRVVKITGVSQFNCCSILSNETRVRKNVGEKHYILSIPLTFIVHFFFYLHLLLIHRLPSVNTLITPWRVCKYIFLRRRKLTIFHILMGVVFHIYLYNFERNKATIIANEIVI